MSAKFYHHLRDTIILLGGGTRIADMASRPSDISEADVDELRSLNIRLLDAIKARTVNVNRLTLELSDE